MSPTCTAKPSFAQASNVDPARHGGTGLGLAIVRQLTGLMGGKV